MKLFGNIRIHLIALVGFLLANVFYFYPQLEGKKIEQSDISHFVGMSKEMRDYNKTHDDVTLWTNSMFGGMPTYQIGAPQQSNISRFFQKLTQLFISRPIGYFLSMMIGFYILMLCLRINPWLGMIGALAFAWSTNHFVLFEAGHTSKLEVISSLPLLTAGIILLLRRLWIPGLTIYAIGLGINIYANHYQMTYYFSLTLVVLMIVELVKWIRNAEWNLLGKTAGYLAVGTAIALSLGASKLLTTMEYSEDTMRGEPILESEAGEEVPAGSIGSSSTTKGLDWEYAMRWSNGTSDVIAGIIPGFAGGSAREYIKKGSPLDLDLRRRGIRPQRGEQELQFGTYWGPLPFTSGPAYFGAIMIFLFLLGALLVKDTLKWWFIGGVILTVILSYGKNMEMIQRLFFDYVPLYNKFRTPNSILSITAFLIPAFALMGASAALSGKHTKDDVWKAVKLSAGITAGFCLLMWLLGSTFFKFQSGTNDQMFQDYPDLYSKLVDYRISAMRSDALRSAVLILLAGGVIWAFINKKLKMNYAILIIGGLVLVDMAGIGRRYLNQNTFQSGKVSTDGYTMRPVDRQILDAEPRGRGYYRVLDMSPGDPFSSAFASYFHNALNGYHAAKLQRIQDIIEHHIAKNNLKVLNMFNTKYMIQKQQVNEQQSTNVVLPIKSANGTAWFVSRTIPVHSANAEIDSLTNFNEKEEAVILTDEFPGFNFRDNYTAEGSIELVDYEPNNLVYETSDLEGEHMAVFPEVWYGPDKGWQAYIDDQPVDHFRANYILRGLIVPEGKHTVRFEFKPSVYYTGERISMTASVVIVLLIALNVFALYRKPEWLGLEAARAGSDEKDQE